MNANNIAPKRESVSIDPVAGVKQTYPDVSLHSLTSRNSLLTWTE